MDDSQLNPEEETTVTVQSGADDASLVSRLVGVLGGVCAWLIVKLTKVLFVVGNHTCNRYSMSR